MFNYSLQLPIFTWLIVRFLFFENSVKIYWGPSLWNIYWCSSNVEISASLSTTHGSQGILRSTMSISSTNRWCQYFSLAVATPCWHRGHLQRWSSTVPNGNWDPLSLFSIHSPYQNTRFPGHDLWELTLHHLFSFLKALLTLFSGTISF